MQNFDLQDATKKNEECGMHSEQKQTIKAKGKNMDAEKLNELNQLNGTEAASSPVSSPPVTRESGDRNGAVGSPSWAGPQLPTSRTETTFGERVNGQLLLDELEDVLRRFVVLPEFAAETLALWVVHTYAFELRDVSTYLGIESPEKRCGKTTLLGVLSKLVNRPVAAANISASAFFRVIEEIQPTLLIDEADTFLRGNEELRGILNAGYTRETAYVIRVSNAEGPRSKSEIRNPKFEIRNKVETRNSKIEMERGGDEWDQCGSKNGQAQLARFSCWCPKVMAAIGRLPETLADRCIVIRMERKMFDEECERLRSLEAGNLREGCEQFVKENEKGIAGARPGMPESLNDRAADIWEPLLAIADCAGGHWPEKARRAAEGLTGNAQSRSEIGSLLFDIFYGFAAHGVEKMLSRDLVGWLNRFEDRPWMDLPGLRCVDGGKRKEVTELWLSRQLRPYGVRPRNMRDGERVAKGYVEEEMIEVFQRYVPRYEVDAFKAEMARQQQEREREERATSSVKSTTEVRRSKG